MRRTVACVGRRNKSSASAAHKMCAGRVPVRKRVRVSAQLFARRSSLNAEWPTHCERYLLLFSQSTERGIPSFRKGKHIVFRKLRVLI